MGPVLEGGKVTGAGLEGPELRKIIKHPLVHHFSKKHDRFLLCQAAGGIKSREFFTGDPLS